jgi:hypothetical protein
MTWRQSLGLTPRSKPQRRKWINLTSSKLSTSLQEKFFEKHCYETGRKYLQITFKTKDFETKIYFKKTLKTQQEDNTLIKKWMKRLNKQLHQREHVDNKSAHEEINHWESPNQSHEVIWPHSCEHDF